MMFPSSTVVAVLALVLQTTTTTTDAFCHRHHQRRQIQQQHLQQQQEQPYQSRSMTTTSGGRSTTTNSVIVVRSTEVEEVSASNPSSDTTTTEAAAISEETNTKVKLESLTRDIVSKLRFRELQRELERRQMDASGTYTDMKQRLLHVATIDDEENEGTGGSTTSPSSEMNGSDSDDVRVIDQDFLNTAFQAKGISFQDASDPDFEFNNLVRDILMHSKKKHWKQASRKLKKLMRKYGPSSSDPKTIPEQVFTSVLKAYAQDRLHGARAAEPARRAMEEMVANGYPIPGDIANYCIMESLGFDQDGTHEGFGGIDTVLAMMAAVSASDSPPVIRDATYERLARVMAMEGSIDDTLHLLRELVVDKSMTPSLKTFAAIGNACSQGTNDPQKLMTVLAYAKAAGYELDNIGSTVDGRALLAAGVIAAEKMGNVGLGLRFLTAARNAEGCEPDKGDALVAMVSPAAARACTSLHRQAIYTAATNNSWKLAVKLLELALERGLTVSPSAWRNVVLCCAKNEKSRKAVALLMNWVGLYKNGRAEKPPLRVFNTVVNACEVCGEEELTVQVLDTMFETHETEGNLITFNIALKRLAKQGNTKACEGIIVGMLQSGIEPSVVSYTTAIAACVAEPKQSETAMEWIKRMKSRKVQPNVITYNTALASCLDGSLAGSMRASQLASDMVADIEKQVESGIIDQNEYTNIIPNFYTRSLARQAMKQLKANWEEDTIDKAVAKSTVRVPLLKLVEFLKTDLAELAEKQKEFITKEVKRPEEEKVNIDIDEELEYSAAISTHRAAAV